MGRHHTPHSNLNFSTMEFIYLANTPQAPEVAVIFKHRFVKEEITEVKDENLIRKFLGMSHIGIIKYEDYEHKKTTVVQRVKEIIQKVKADSRSGGGIDPFLKELTPNATLEHIESLVNSKSGNDLKKFVIRSKIEIKDLRNIKAVELKATLSKDVIKYLKAQIATEFQLQKGEDYIEKKVKSLVDSKTYNNLKSFARKHNIPRGYNLKMDDLKKVIIEFLIKNPDVLGVDKFGRKITNGTNESTNNK